jgi:nitrate reductase delta subunit
MDRLFTLLAGILEYPNRDLAGLARECEGLAKTAGLPAEPFDRFARFLEHTPVERQEELYTAAFDMSASCCPFVGYHLFGDGYQRSAFMLELRKRYDEWSFSAGRELPDHLAVMLRFLAVCGSAEEREVIIREAILPALERMLDPEKHPDAAADSPGVSPYRQVLGALGAALARTLSSEEG